MDKTVIVILSTMRAGSTLLKSLLQEAEDVSRLPEMDFHEVSSPGEMEDLSDKPIVVLKKPPGYHAVRSYPYIPDWVDPKFIVLVRNVSQNLMSIKRMTLGPVAYYMPQFINRLFVESYWCRVYENILDHPRVGGERTTYVSYEELTKEPVKETKRLYEFIGSQRVRGTDQYQRKVRKFWSLANYSRYIDESTVKEPKPREVDPALRKVIEESERLSQVQSRLASLLKRRSGQVSSIRAE
ncbi:MAG: sulfotransferase family protein [Candidatus Acetothermia bacterium]